MALKSLFVVIYLCVLHYNSVACDACGCGASNSSLGMLSSLQKNTVSLSWSMSPFSSTNISSITEDRFHALEFSGRFYLNKRLKAVIFQPYQFNTRHTSSQDYSLQGLSDTRAMLNYTVYQSTGDTSGSRTYFEIGTGISLPTGKYDKALHNKDLPENFNLGRGALGYLFQSNFLSSGNKVGFMAQTMVQAFGKSSDGYLFGQQIQATAFIFHKLKLKGNLKLLPSLGLIAEYLAHDQYANGKTVHGTGGKGLFPGLSLSLRSKRWLIGLLAAQPLLGEYSDAEVTAMKRFSCQLSFIF